MEGAPFGAKCGGLRPSARESQVAILSNLDLNNRGGRGHFFEWRSQSLAFAVIPSKDHTIRKNQASYVKFPEIRSFSGKTLSTKIDTCPQLWTYIRKSV
jgi:hypothetical protein